MTDWYTPVLTAPQGGCPLDGGCRVLVERVPTRYAIRIQHGDNPEHSKEFDALVAFEPHLWPDGQPVMQSWLDRVHEYLKAGPQL